MPLIVPRPITWKPLPSCHLPPTLSKELKGLQAEWTKGTNALTADRRKFDAELADLQHVATVEEATRKSGDLRNRLGDLFKAELELRQKFAAVVLAAVEGWKAERDRRLQAVQQWRAKLAEVLAANGWPVKPPPELPHCWQVPDLLHRNAELTRLVQMEREAFAWSDQTAALRYNEENADQVRAELHGLMTGAFVGMATIADGDGRLRSSNFGVQNANL